MANDLTLLIDTANAPIFGIGADGLVNEWNRKMAAITGFSREDVMGKNLVSEFISVEFRQSVKEVLENALLGVQTDNYQLPLFTKDKRRVELLLNATTRVDATARSSASWASARTSRRSTSRRRSCRAWRRT